MTINADRYGDPYAVSGGSSGDEGERAPTPSEDTTGASAESPAAARLLEMTARETDQWRAEARNEADALVAAAREESAVLVRAARAEAERVMREAREQAAQTTNDARVEAYRVREETAAARRRHDEDVAHLEEVATQHRERLRRHLVEMLDQVDDAPGEPGP